MPNSIDPKRNHLLASLPEGEWSRWRDQLEMVSLPLGKVLYESGGVQS
ncbi:MAG: Crp/Fnr family transcriptional regulator, partial [Comamonadaceae bacterium]